MVQEGRFELATSSDYQSDVLPIKLLLHMVNPVRLELTTPRLKVECIFQLSYGFIGISLNFELGHKDFLPSSLPR